MRHVGIREFRDNATTLLYSGEKLVVERHGQAIGYFIPVRHKTPEQSRLLLEEFDALLEGILERNGLSEDEFASVPAVTKRGK